MFRKFIQVNLNRSWPAYNLFTQMLVEREIAVGLISEPPARRGSNFAGWLTSRSRLAAIVWNPGRTHGCSLLHRGRDFVAARMNGLILVSCYITPRSSREHYQRFLDDLGDLISAHDSSRIIIAGDFNARSPAWNPGVTHNFKGTLLEEWAAEKDLRLINEGETPTCVNPRGFSVVDDLGVGEPGQLCSRLEGYG